MLKASLLVLGVFALLSAVTVFGAHAGTHNCDLIDLKFTNLRLNQAVTPKGNYYTASVAAYSATTSPIITQVDPMAAIRIKIGTGSWQPAQGFGLSNSAIQLGRGSTPIYIEIECGDCKTVITIVITCGPGGVVGDPQFSGLKGQEYQIHGVAGAVYNIISDPRMQMNSRFVFLNKGQCPVVAGIRQKGCFSHPGSYLGEIGIQTAAGDQIRLVSGPAGKGYAGVEVNGRQLSVGDEVTLEGAFISRNTTHMVTVHASVFQLELENSDMYINQAVKVNDWDLVTHAHGLLGQTWNTKTYSNTIKHIEGTVDDYLVQEQDIFGSNYVYNRFD